MMRRCCIGRFSCKIKDGDKTKIDYVPDAFAHSTIQSAVSLFILLPTLVPALGLEVSVVVP